MIEPRRLIDEESASELGSALREARAATGGEAQLERLWQKLGQPAGAAAGTATSGVSTLAAGKGWIALAVLALGALAAVVFVAIGEREAAAPLQRPQASAASPRPLDAARSRAASGAAPAAGSDGLRSADELRGPPIAPAPPSAAPTAPVTARRAPRQQVVIATKAKAAHQSAPLALDPDAELALLTRAEQALELKPAVALAILDEHAQRFPDGVLAQEREVMSIDAELALGHKSAAAARARAFLVRFPSSAHHHRFAALLEAQLPAPGDHKTNEPRIPTGATPKRR
jgi:hypothetical protein